jgi:hypothetical protein
MCAGTRNGRMERQLPRLFRRAGLVELKVVPVTVTFGDDALADHALGPEVRLKRARANGTKSAAVAEWWAHALQDADQASEFFCAISGFIVKGG